MQENQKVEPNKSIPRGSKDISGIVGDRRSSYNMEGYDRVAADEIIDQKLVGIPLIDKIVIFLVLIYTVLVFIQFSFTAQDEVDNDDIEQTMFITKVIEFVILWCFVLEVTIRIITQGFISYFSDFWTIFDALIITASIVLIILDFILVDTSFTTISKVLRGIFRFLRLFLVFRKFNQVKKINNIGTRYNVRSPVEKVIDIMKDLADQFEDPMIIKQLNWGITHISNNTVYEPIIEGRRSEALGWLNQQQQLLVSQDFKKSISQDVTFIDNTNLPAKVIQDFKTNILNLDYDYFSLFNTYDNQILTYLLCYYFEIHELFSGLRISPEQLKKCSDKIGQSYHKDNPYHNVIHAFDVTHTVYFFIEKCDYKTIGKLSKLDYSILLLSAAAHDSDHPGFNNIYLSNTRNELAMIYNDRSPLEQHHSSNLFKFIRDTDLFLHFTTSDIKYFREKAINMILSTDNAMHGKDFNKLKARLASSDFEPSNKDKGICFDTLLHAADISNPFKPMKNYEQWTFRVLNEFWIQGDKEKELGLPVTMLCDRRTTNVARSQIGFIDFMVIPYYNALAQILPQLNEYLEQISQNKKVWAEQIDYYQGLLNTQ